MEGGDLGELYTIVVFEVVVVWKEVILILRTVYIHTAPRHTFGRDAVGGSRTVPRGPTTLDRNLELSTVHRRTIRACMDDISSSFLSRKDTSGRWMRNVPHQESPRTLTVIRDSPATPFLSPFDCVHFSELLLDKFAAEILSF